MTISASSCPVCGSEDLQRILDLEGIPVFCNVQLDSREEARSQPKGNMHLEYCRSCTHIYNSDFDETLLAYDQSYENSLHFSGTFNSFAQDLAQRLVESHDLYDKKVVDIGCGKGDFLALVCELGRNAGFGFDKSYEEGRATLPKSGSVIYFREFFSEVYSDIEPDLVTCRHVLEHIPGPGNFLSGIARAVSGNPQCKFYFEVPNALYNIRDLGIWDLIYEHCQYFTPQSVRAALMSAGLQVVNVKETFGGQFLSLDAVPGDVLAHKNYQPPATDSQNIGAMAVEFRDSLERIVTKWREQLRAYDGKVVVWGAGSKGVTFLNLVDSADRVRGIVDINPHKHGKYVAGTGHKVIAPDKLIEIQPDCVLIMNPLYIDEIRDQLASIGLMPDVIAVR